MRRLGSCVLLVLACQPSPPPPPPQPPAQPATAPAPPVNGKCDCDRACDCYGVDDPERDLARNQAREECRLAGATCNCSPCDAP